MSTDLYNILSLILKEILLGSIDNKLWNSHAG